MRCPSCGYPESKVVDSRPVDEGASIRRRRECLSCGSRFTTYERTEHSPLLIIKSDGSTETYNREKLFHGLLIACAKRPVSPDQLYQLIDDIETDLRNDLTHEITSKALGDKALEKLANIDEVAYIRFASVYKDFKNVDEFKEALKGF